MKLSVDINVDLGEGGADEYAPIGIVRAPDDFVGAGLGFIRGPLVCSVPADARSKVLLLEDRIRYGRGTLTIAWGIAHQKAKGVPARLANHVAAGSCLGINRVGAADEFDGVIVKVLVELHGIVEQLASVLVQSSRGDVAGRRVRVQGLSQTHCEKDRKADRVPVFHLVS